MRRTTTICWRRARWVLPSAGAVRRFAQSPMKSSTEQDRRPSPITRRVTAQPRLRAEQMGRRRLLLGHEHTGEPVNLAIRGRTVLIAGEPETGKSWLAGLLC